MRKLKVAVVGTGLFGSIHVDAYAQYHRSELVIICDLDEKRVKKLARKYQCAWTTDFRDVARMKEVEAVSIATPDFAHTPIALAMIRAGKHLLIEKPITTSTREARSIVERAKTKNVRIMVDFHNRFSAPFIEAKRALDAGEVGSPIMGYARLSNRISVPLKMLSWAGKSGPEWFLMPHIVDLMRWLVGAEATEVYATGTKGILKSRGVDAYDAIQAQVRFQGGAFVTFETAWVLPPSSPSVIDFKVNLVGSKGAFNVQADHQLIELWTKTVSHPFVTGKQDVHGETAGFMQLPMRHFVSALLDDTPFVVTGEDGVRTTQIIESALKSIRTGSPVRIS